MPLMVSGAGCTVMPNASEWRRELAVAHADANVRILACLRAARRARQLTRARAEREPRRLVRDREAQRIAFLVGGGRYEYVRLHRLHQRRGRSRDRRRGVRRRSRRGRRRLSRVARRWCRRRRRCRGDDEIERDGVRGLLVVTHRDLDRLAHSPTLPAAGVPFSSPVSALNVIQSG